MTTQEKPFTHIGRSEIRIEGRAKVTGHARYTADIQVPGMLYARLVTSPYAHARITHIDSEAALAVPGVVRVVTAADLPLLRDATASRKRVPLADGEVLFAGQPVVVVLGESEIAARDGAAEVQVLYEDLPTASAVDMALSPDAPLVRKREELGSAAGHGSPGSAAPQELPQNVANRSELKQGDIEQGFAAAAAIVETTFRLPMVHQGYMEPMACTVVPDPFGNLTVYATTQSLFDTRSEVAKGLGVPVSRVKVVLPHIGGGFGAKAVLLEPLCAALAMMTKRPVHLSFTRMEDLAATNPMPDCSITLKMGADSAGVLTALQARCVFDTGAYPGSPMGFVVYLLSLYYPVPNYEIEGIEVVTHRVGGGSYRSPGGPQMTFAVESQMDALAHMLGIDTLTMHRRNMYPGNDSANAVLAELEKSALWQKRLDKKPNEGFGIAFSGSASALGPASANCRLNDDGTFSIVTGLSDLTGATTGLALIAAEILDMPPSNIAMVTGDSDSAPYTGATGGSRATSTLGAAVKRAAEDARAQIFAIAADKLEANPDDLELRDGGVSVKGTPSRTVRLTEISEMSGGYEGRYEPVLGRGRSANKQFAVGCYVHLAHVRVDPETGDVTVLDYLAIHDVGNALNPAEVAAQIHGGVTQGLGWALYEQMVYDENGALLSGSLMDYALQTAPMVPPIQTIVVGVPSSEGPFGAKGIGEPPIVPPAAAVSNAIFDAIGLRPTELPATPERVFDLLRVARHSTSV